MQASMGTYIRTFMILSLENSGYIALFSIANLVWLVKSEKEVLHNIFEGD